MKKPVVEAFRKLNEELLLAMGSDFTSLADSILYGNLVADIEDVRYKYTHLIDQVGKKETATSTANTDSGSKQRCPMEDNSLAHNISLDEKSDIVKPPVPAEEATAFWLREMLIAMRKAHLDSHQEYDVLAAAIFHLAGGDR